ncbi:MAG: ferrous iron transport protein A [Pyrinomonadaceae bacterium MAG19_C2-C3]|nr:ferrous iron transport protein A [Pyrinomonadaceae bacterium MAG19_C2-C3]
MCNNLLISDTSVDNAPTNAPHVRQSPTTQLCCLPFGVQARITGIDSRDAVARRLMEMGVLPGAMVRVIKAAPFGCPLEIEVRGYRLAMRRAEAAHVSVVAG